MVGCLRHAAALPRSPAIVLAGPLHRPSAASLGFGGALPYLPRITGMKCFRSSLRAFFDWHCPLPKVPVMEWLAFETQLHAYWLANPNLI